MRSPFFTALLLAIVHDPAATAAEPPRQIEMPFISALAATYAPTVTDLGGSQTLTMPFIAATAATYAPSYEAQGSDQSLVMPFISALAATYAPTITDVGSGQSLDMPFIAALASTFAPTIQAVGWQVVYQPGTVTVTSSTSTGTHRNRIPASLVPAGTKVRVTYRGNTDIARAFIGLKAPSGDAFDFSAAPTQILFSGGATASIGTGLDQLSDEIDFVQDGSSDIILSIEKSAGSQLRNLALTGASRWINSSLPSDGDTVDTSGYTETTNSVRIAVKFEVYGPL